MADPATTLAGFAAGMGEGNPLAAAMMDATHPIGYLAAAAIGGIAATVLAAGRATAWWSKTILVFMAVLAVAKLGAITWNISLLLTS